MQGGLILVALLAGGDYHNGMPGCGLTIAHGLARCGFGNRLVDAFYDMPRNGFTWYLHHTWADDVCTELRTNSRGFLHTQQLQLANQLPAFLLNLSHDTVEKYASPLTARNHGEGTISTSSWAWQAPNVTSITELCFSHLGWAEVTELVPMLRKNVWEGIFYQMLLSVSHTSI